MKPIRIALTNGRLEKDSVEMFEKLGYDCTAVHEKGRRLFCRSWAPTSRLCLRRPRTW